MGRVELYPQGLRTRRIPFKWNRSVKGARNARRRWYGVDLEFETVEESGLSLLLSRVVQRDNDHPIPPTANLDDLDPRCDLDYVPCKARKVTIRTAISSSFAFGGANNVMVFRQYPYES